MQKYSSVLNTKVRHPLPTGKFTKFLAKIRKKEKIQITKIRDEGRDITTNLIERKGLIMYANKLYLLHEMDKLLEIHKLPKWTQE